MNIDLSEKQIKHLMSVIYKSSGINLHEGKKELLKAKISKRMRMTKISSAQEYVKILESDENEFLEFIDTVTTNHTYFFRENAGCEYVVKQFIEKRPGKPIKVWCAASSTGEEPYSIAVQFLNAGIDVQILATDISHTVLQEGMRGIYHKSRAKNIPLPILHRYFQKGTNNNSDKLKVKPEVKNTVTFKKFNLISDPLPGTQFDIIFCRNVMIYFDEKTVEKVVNKLTGSLMQGGYFLIGNAESLINHNHNLSIIKKVPSTYTLGKPR